MNRLWILNPTFATTVILIALSGLIHLTVADVLSCLKNIEGSKRSYLTTPSSSTYSIDRLVYARNFDFAPVAIYHPATNNDAAAAIQCAAAYHIAVAPRSGGHSYEGYSAGGRNGSLVIDLNLFQQFSVDTNTNIATIGAGTRLGPLYTRLWKAGEYLIPAGTCATVGIGGIALGGGLGVVARKYGMLTDNIVSMTMVDANGNILHVSPTSNPDLFWALRGAGGGSFGLVTEFRIQVYKAPEKVTRMQINWPLTKYSDVISAFGKWGMNVTENIFAGMHFEKFIFLQINFLGPKEEAQAAVGPLLRDTGEPSLISIWEGSWLQAVIQWSVTPNEEVLANPDLTSHRYHRSRSILYRKPMGMDEMNIINRFMSSPPEVSSKTYLILDLWGGKINQPNSPAAFDNHRGVIYSLAFGTEWKNSSLQPDTPCPTCLEWSANFAKELHDAYSSGSPLEAYQNYIEKDFPNAMYAYYGYNLPRLQQIKLDVDPSNVFTFPQSIPLPKSSRKLKHLVIQ
ncbi:hypothetical protein FBU30_010113 [Linnemannia zychae]|nr:hypothetical protein FBU30_010113 [Linnemannia zychae]